MKDMHNKKEKVVIVGDGEIASMVYEYFTYDSEYEVVGFSVDKEFLKNRKLFGLPVVPFESVEEKFSPNCHKMFIAISFTQLNRLRERFFYQAKEKGYSLVSYINSKASVWRNVKIGENCYILESSVVHPFAEIGDNVLIGPGNYIGHHSIIRDHTWISMHAVVSGFVEVCEYCFLGANATIIDNIKIGRNCLIGAGATILRDTEENKVYGSKMTGTKEYSSLAYFGAQENEI